MRGKRGRHLDDEQPVGIRRRRDAARRSVPPACSERLHQPSASGGVATVAITRGASALEQRLEAAEVRGGEADVGARITQGALDRAEEARQVVHVGCENTSVPGEQQRAVDAQLGPVVALAERREELRRLARAERDPERVGGLDSGGGVVGG